MTTTMDQPVRVKLTDETLIEYGQHMAAKLLHVGVLRKKKADDAKSTQALIDEELDEAQRLARIITETEEERRQGDLHFGDVPSTSEAQEALAQVAATCSCEDENVRSLDCLTHRPGTSAVDYEDDEEDDGELETAAVK
jgi:hypothetical protein